MITKLLKQFSVVLLAILVTGCGGKAWTVTEVIQRAERLDGKTIRVRGWSYLWTNPSRATMWLYGGGCAVKSDPNERQGYVQGWLTLCASAYPDEWGGDGAPYDETGVKISESSFKCEGDFCKITCSPFEVVSERMYEFVGTLRVSGNAELTLENIDLDNSRQRVDGNWISITTSDFDVMFP